MKIHVGNTYKKIKKSTISIFQMNFSFHLYSDFTPGICTFAYEWNRGHLLCILKSSCKTLFMWAAFKRGYTLSSTICQPPHQKPSEILHKLSLYRVNGNSSVSICARKQTTLLKGEFTRNWLDAAVYLSLENEKIKQGMFKLSMNDQKCNYF